MTSSIVVITRKDEAAYYLTRSMQSSNGYITRSSDFQWPKDGFLKPISCKLMMPTSCECLLCSIIRPKKDCCKSKDEKKHGIQSLNGKQVKRSRSNTTKSLAYCLRTAPTLSTSSLISVLKVQKWCLTCSILLSLFRL